MWSSGRTLVRISRAPAVRTCSMAGWDSSCCTHSRLDSSSRSCAHCNVRSVSCSSTAAGRKNQKARRRGGALRGEGGSLAGVAIRMTVTGPAS